jgi:hypothetical protein
MQRRNLANMKVVRISVDFIWYDASSDMSHKKST